MYEFSTRVSYSEVDGKGRLSMVALMNLLQDCATFHSEDAGYGLSWLMKMQRGWFVTSYKLRINGLPQMGDEVRVATYPTMVKGLIGERYFTVTSTDGTVMYARAKSLWVYMNIAEKKPARIPEDMSRAYGCDEPPTDEEWGGRKIQLAKHHTPAYDFTVSPLFIDSNHHMNNAYYIEAARAALPEGCEAGELAIEYRKPAMLHDRVWVSRDVSDGRVQVALKGDDGELFSVVDFTTVDK